MTTHRAACTLAFLLYVATMDSANAQQTKVPDEPGTVTYHGPFEGGGVPRGPVGDLKIGPAHGGMSRVTIVAGSSGCGESVSGMASVQGDTLLLTKDDSGNECRLTIHRTANSATVKEESCMMDHGPSCGFSGGPLRRVR